MALENGAVPPRRSVAARHRWVVHLALLATGTTSLVLEPVVTVHVVLGLAFVGLVVVHVVQRRQVSMALARWSRRSPSTSRNRD